MRATPPGDLAEVPSRAARARRFGLWLLFALALAPRLWHVHSVLSGPLAHYHESFDQSDMYMFDQWSRRIAAGDWLGREPYRPLFRWQLALAPADQWLDWMGRQPSFFKAPLYPYALATWRAVGQDPLVPMLLAQALASAWAVLLLAVLGERLFGRRAGLYAALGMAGYAPAIHFDVLLLRGPWIALLGVALSLSLVRLLQSGGGWRRALGLGALAGVGLLLYEGLAPLLLLLPAVVVLALRGRARWTALASVAAGVVLALLPLVARNVAVGVAPFQVVANGTTALATTNAAGVSPVFHLAPPAEILPVMHTAPAGLGGLLWACVRSHGSPGAVLRFYGSKLAGLLAPFESTDNVNFYYAALRDPLLAWLPGFTLLMPLSLAGLALARPAGRALWALLPYTATLLGTIVLTLPVARYRATLAVVLWLFAGLSLARGEEYLRARRWRALCALVGAALGVAALAQWLETHVVFARYRRAAVTYRAAEFWLEANAEVRAGRPARALRPLLELAQLNPALQVRIDALTGAARIAAGLPGAGATVRGALRAARTAAVGNAEALAAVGDAYAESARDLPAATEAWQAALELSPSGPLADTLRGRLAAAGTPPGP